MTRHPHRPRTNPQAPARFPEARKDVAPAPTPAEPSGSSSSLREEVVRLRGDLDRMADLYGDLVGRLRSFAAMEEAYLRLLALYGRFGVVSPELLAPKADDPISRDIVRVMAMISEGSIQEIADRVRSVRGSASRRIGRARLEDLERSGTVEVRRSRGGRRRWRLSDEVVKKWSEMLGLRK